MGTLRAEIFGGINLVHGGSQVNLRGTKRCLIAAMLVTNANTPVAVDRLIDVLDPNRLERDPLNALQAQIRRLRMVLQPQDCAASCDCLTTESDSYRLRVDEMDLWEFRHLVRSARSLADTNPCEAITMYRRALSRWNDPLGAIGAHGEFADVLRSLDLERLTAEDEMIESILAVVLQGDSPQVSSSCRESCEATVDMVTALARSEPLREHRAELAMHILYLAGRQAESLELFGHTRGALREGLGVSPGPPLVRMWERVLNHDDSLRNDHRKLQSSHGDQHRVIDPGPLCMALSGLAAYRGHVSIVGSEQSGKTRLASRWMRTQDVLEKVCWVDMTVGDLAELETLNGAGSVAVVLDGADSTNPEVSELIIDLRARHPDVFVVVTAREPIGLAGENVIQIPPLMLG